MNVMTYVSEMVEFVAARRGSPTLISPVNMLRLRNGKNKEYRLSLVFGVYNVVVFAGERRHKKCVDRRTWTLRSRSNSQIGFKKIRQHRALDLALLFFFG
jgi:hypothetical protein